MAGEHRSSIAEGFRESRSLRPGNTPCAYRAASTFDRGDRIYVWLSKDGVLILVHDGGTALIIEKREPIRAIDLPLPKESGISRQETGLWYAAADTVPQKNFNFF